MHREATPSTLTPPEISLTSVVEERKGIWKKWLNLTALPRNAQTTATPFLRQKLRRSEFISYTLLILSLILSILFSISLIETFPSYFLAWFVTVLINVAFVVVVAALNARGHVTVAGFVLVILPMLSYVISLLLTNVPLSTFDLYTSYITIIYLILISGLVLPPRLHISMVIFYMAFIVYHFFFRATGPEIISIKHTQGISFLISPLFLIAWVTFMSWLYMRNMEKAILRADKAEDLAETQKQLLLQTAELATLKQQLDEGIVELLHVHQQASSGNYAVRASVHPDNNIWQIGQSLNTLLARYQRLAFDSQELGSTRQDCEALALWLERMRIASYLEKMLQHQGAGFPRCNSPLGKRLSYALGFPVPLPTPRSR